MNNTCNRLATLLLASGGFCYSQTFHSDEEFYRFIENRQRMAINEMYARKAAAIMAAEKVATAREHEHQRRAQMLENDRWVDYLKAKLDVVWTQEERDAIIQELNALREKP